ncbi:MAG TPA: GNAT family N-acetyltransferase [Acidimicrobiales bacterium]|nr:GNAT family N-acetyltransferase [Acidimicrobiales bacterium]
MVVLRPARPDDALAVAGVHVRSWQAGYRGLLPDHVLDALRPEERARHYRFAHPDPAAPATVVAVEDGTVVGFATTGLGPSGTAGGDGEVLALYVDPGWWGRGVGRGLVAGARAALARAGAARGLLWVLAGNTRAGRFYRADGWAPDGTRRRAEVWGVDVEERCYRRPTLDDAPP